MYLIRIALTIWAILLVDDDRPRDIVQLDVLKSNIEGLTSC